MATFQPTHAPILVEGPRGLHIDETDLRWALNQGWRDFMEKRGDILVLALIYPIAGFAAAAAAFNEQYLSLLFPLVAGLSIMGPGVASGFYELARRREAGLDSSWIHFVDPLRGRSRAGIALLSVGLVAMFAAWLVAAWLVFSATIGAYPAGGLSEFVRRVFTTPEGWAMIVVGNLVGLIFAAATLVLAVVSFPMVVDKPVDAGLAVTTSIRAVWENPSVMLSWGLRVAGLLVLGCLPGFVGLAVVLPVLGYATWHLYTRLVER
jgi:uncharacterized membrane protein